ncbi:methylaspartate mutase [Saccharothrix longispora]|uniref:methylaspartate mutase n=1 Tax=Saccharothrix longispora TaxID=33920 RepID=UPI0028FD544B|nr:methylaspartate mutase [Saccharothrix longispora]MBY8850677.1 methylaspartate mutase [Saccharothrix sp. MB29]MDU0292359.1 methylaspartate mutase [Saccharothrix longispora]
MSDGSFGGFVARAAAEGELVVQPRMGLGDPAAMRAGLAAVRGSGVRAVGTITLDSFTRVGDHDAVRAALAAGDALNGYPIVAYPRGTTREVLRGLAGDAFPVQVRHGSARPQDIVVALLEAGLHATEGGPLSYCLPYSRVPVAEAVRAWTESCLLLAELRDRGGEPHLESFGGCMMGQLCPPGLLVAISVLEGVFFRRHGLGSMSLSYAQQTHPGQDAEAVRALRVLAAEHLSDVDWHVVLYTYMGVFPRTRRGASALLEQAAELAVRTGAERLIVKTTAEAHRIPTVAENVAALRAASAAAARAEPGGPVEDTGVLAEARAIVEAVLDLAPDPGVALVRAVERGYLDVPYCLHPDNAGRTRAVVDRTGRLRWSRTGSLPLAGLVEATTGAEITSTELLRSLSHVERTFDDAALDRVGAHPVGSG